MSVNEVKQSYRALSRVVDGLDFASPITHVAGQAERQLQQPGVLSAG